MRIEYFQLIDRIDAVNSDPLTLVASAQVPAEASIFEGHFPSYPLMPGVLLIEAMAQAAGFCLLWRNEFSAMPFLVTVREAKLRHFVQPASRLAVSCEVEHEGSGYAFAKTSVECDGQRACNAVLGFRFLPFPTPDLLEHLKARASELGLPERVES